MALSAMAGAMRGKSSCILDCRPMCKMYHMKTATIRQVRHDLSSVLAWVAAGEEVTVLNRARPVARLCPLRVQSARKTRMPDFAARAQAIFGNRKPTTNVILQERSRSRW
jgi:antitoxin (DNA-binding transcriptional repressor) of toxin-antitoxin stability system